MSKLSQPETPWRRVRFIPARKGSGLSGGGRVVAEVYLGNTWHEISLGMDGEGFKKLSALLERSRMLLLESLATMPIRGHNPLLAEKKRPRGRNDKSSLIAWYTARTFGPPLLDWAKQAKAEGNNKSMGLVLKAMKKDGLTNTSPEGVMAYLLDRNWQNAHRINPERFPKWKHSPPSKLKTFLKQIIRSDSETRGTLPEPPETFITNILSGAKPPQVYILSNYEIEPAIPMTDFRFY